MESRSKDNRSVASSSIPEIIGKMDGEPEKWVLRVCPTTGGEIELAVSSNLTVEGLKHIIGKKLKIPVDKINLLYKDK